MKLGLLFRALTKRVGAEIDLLTVLVYPDDCMAVFANTKLLEIFDVLQICESLSARDNRPQIDNADIAIIPFDFQHAVDDRLCRNHSSNLSHRRQDRKA